MPYTTNVATSELSAQLKSFAETNLIGQSFKHKLLPAVQQTVTEIISVDKIPASCFLEILFKTSEGKKYGFNTLLANNLAAWTNQDAIEAFAAEFNAYALEHKAYLTAQQAAVEKARKEQLATEQAEKERLKAMEQRKLANDHLMKKLSALKPDTSDNNFFVKVGWLAKHCKKITVSMPDALETWFINTVGDMPHSISTGKTINNNPMKYTLSISATVDDQDNLPIYFKDCLNSKGTKIASTELLFSLLKDFGFSSDKIDPDEIRKYIPTAELANFEKGFAR